MESVAEQPTTENVFRNYYSDAQINLIIIEDLLNEKCRIFHCLFISLNLKIPVVGDFFPSCFVVDYIDKNVFC